jgi:hypothetical protein
MRTRCLVIVTLLPLVWMDALPAEWKAATLFANGKLVDGKGIVLTRETSFEGPRLCNSNGIKINSFDEVENNTDIFSLQSEEEEPHLHFMWPARYVGHKVEVQNLDRKVELETINLSPHNSSDRLSTCDFSFALLRGSPFIVVAQKSHGSGAACGEEERWRRERSNQWAEETQRC